MCACVRGCARIYMYVETSYMCGDQGLISASFLRIFLLTVFFERFLMALSSQTQVGWLASEVQVSTSKVLGLWIYANTARIFPHLFVFVFVFYM